MELQEFIDMLYAAGWKAPNDAQHERIKKVYAEIVALTQRVKQLETANAKYNGSGVAEKEGDVMGITPEICTHCGQAIGANEGYSDLWKRFLILKSALVQCNASLNIFDIKSISNKALEEVK